MDESSRYLILSLEGGKFALPITRLVEITVPRGVQKDERLPSVFEGAFEFRGRSVPVMDLKKVFKLAGTPGPVLLVVKGARDLMGLLVDAVSEIVDQAQKPAPMPAGVMEPSQRVYAGVLRSKGELILLLNEDGLVP
jgi:chemotaxis signal transduction protein